MDEVDNGENSNKRRGEVFFQENIQLTTGKKVEFFDLKTLTTIRCDQTLSTYL